MISQFMDYFQMALTLGMIIAGVWAYKGSRSKEFTAIQKQTIEALQARQDTLETELEDAKKKQSKTDRIVNTLVYALKHRGIEIKIDGDFITLLEIGNASRNGHTETIKIHEDIKNI